METPRYDFTTALKFLTFIWPESRQPREMRVLAQGKVFSGLYDNPDTMARAACGMADRFNPDRVEFSLNFVEDIADRSINKIKRSRITVNNKQIGDAGLLLVDIDPVRPSGLCATEDEKAEGWSVAENVIAFLTGEGWPRPAIVDSGNGYHLYWLSGEGNGQNTWAWEGVLRLLDRHFSTNGAKVDVATHTPARIARVPGTLNCKGPNTVDRPHRLAYVVEYPEVWIPAPRLYLMAQRHGILSPEQRGFTGHTNRKVLIDEAGVLDFIGEFSDHLALATDPQHREDGTTYFYLAECPMKGEAHRSQGLKTALILGEKGLGFRCFSDDCDDYRMRDLLDKLREETGRRPSMPFYEGDDIKDPVKFRRLLRKLETTFGKITILGSPEQEKANREAKKRREEDRIEQKAVRKAERRAERLGERGPERQAARLAINNRIRTERALDILTINERADLARQLRLNDPINKWMAQTWSDIRSGAIATQCLPTDRTAWGLTHEDLICEPLAEVLAGLCLVDAFYLALRWKTRPIVEVQWSRKRGWSRIQVNPLHTEGDAAGLEASTIEIEDRYVTDGEFTLLMAA